MTAQEEKVMGESIAQRLQSILDLAECRLRESPQDSMVVHDLTEIVRITKAAMKDVELVRAVVGHVG
jgi:hypothetical protein